MKLEHIELLMNNPYDGSEILSHFASGYKKEEIPIQIFYIVLPIIFNKNSLKVFSSIKKSNTLTKIIKENKNIIADIQTPINAFKRLTNLSLIVAHNNNKLKVCDTISVIESSDYNASNTNYKEYHRAAHYLGLICSQEKSHIEIFKKLKVLP